MSGGTGMAGLAVTALVAALIAGGVATLLSSGAPPGSGSPREPDKSPGTPAPSARDEGERLQRLEAAIAELRAARPAPGPSGATPSAGSAGSGSEPGAAATTSPGTAHEPLPTTRAELVALIDERVAAGGADPVAAAKAAAAARKRVTVEEAGAEMGLTTLEIDAVKRAYREAENEMLNAIMGTTDLDAIKEEVRAAKDDPDKKAALVTKCVGNVFRNLGHVMTIEDRRDRELKKFLPEEQVTKLKGYDMKPTFDDSDLESIMEDVFKD